MKQTAVMIVENKVEAEAIALFDGELTFREFMDNINKHFNQAKKMEKEQIIEAFTTSRDPYGISVGNSHSIKKAELYYNETFKSE